MKIQNKKLFPGAVITIRYYERVPVKGIQTSRVVVQKDLTGRYDDEPIWQTDKGMYAESYLMEHAITEVKSIWSRV